MVDGALGAVTIKHARARLEQIDRSQIDMGRGDRALVPGGRLHAIYRVTVTADLLPKESMVGA